MKLQILAMFDKKLGHFMTPFFAQTNGAALRSVGDLVNGKGEELPAQHPEDFQLWELGSWNMLDGSFFVGEPRVIAECENLKTEGR